MCDRIHWSLLEIIKTNITREVETEIENLRRYRDRERERDNSKRERDKTCRILLYMWIVKSSK